MSQKAEKPTLSGQRIKTRKRDEKEKYDPTAFRDAVLLGLNEAGPDLEQISKYLDAAGSKLNYRRYAETLLDVLFAGGILAPGGTVVEDAEPGKPSRTDFCVFKAEDDLQTLKAHYEIFYKLIRRYKYLEKSFEEEMKKLILFLKGFDESHRTKLARIMGIFLGNGLGNAECLSCLFQDHLVKDGLSVTFASEMFNAWLAERDFNNVASSLKRAGLEGKLMLLLPINKRTIENFEAHFNSAGLSSIVDYQKVKANIEMKKELQKQLEEMIKDDEPVKEIVASVKEQMKKSNIAENEAVVMAWNNVMKAVEWNKKEELVAEQALKHLKTYTPLLVALTQSGRSELQLMQKIQEYCYDNMNFMKIFQKIIVLLYKSDVLSEDVILKWYRDGHIQKGKSVFLEQMKKFVDWLDQAEEESGEDED